MNTVHEMNAGQLNVDPDMGEEIEEESEGEKSSRKIKLSFFFFLFRRETPTFTLGFPMQTLVVLQMRFETALGKRISQKKKKKENNPPAIHLWRWIQQFWPAARRLKAAQPASATRTAASQSPAPHTSRECRDPHEFCHKLSNKRKNRHTNTRVSATYFQKEDD